MIEFDSLQIATKLNPPTTFKKEMVMEPPSITVLQIVLSFFSRSILATQTNLSLILKKWYLHAGFGFSSNCHKTQPTNDFQEEMVVEHPSIIVLQIVLNFFSRSILATKTNLSLVLKKWYLHDGVWFASNCHKTQPTKDFQEKMVVEPPSIIVLEIVLSFFSRSILATQTKLSLILKKWYLHAGVWFPSNCQKTQPTNDFQEQMVMEPPSITVLQIVLSFFSRSILATQTNISLILKKWYLHAGVWFPSNCQKTQPTNDFQTEMVAEPPQLLSFKLYKVSFRDPS